MAGLSLARSQGIGNYAGVTAGRVTSSVTGLYLWLGYKATERISVWGVGGYQRGELRDRTGEGQHYRVAGLNLLAAIIHLLEHAEARRGRRRRGRWPTSST